MKKQVFLLLAALLAIGPNAFAYDFSAVAPSGQTLYYNIVSGNAQVTSQNSSSPYYSTYPTGALTIPSSVTYSGTTYAVTSIGQNAIRNCSGLTSITIPSGVTSIGSNAFSGCMGLTSVNYTGTIAQWCNINFYNYYSNPVYYAHTLNINGSPVTNLVIPAGVTTINQYAFYSCIGLTSVSIPSSVTSIGTEAFYNCTGLASIVVANNNTVYDSRNNSNAIIETATNTLIRGCKNTIIPGTITSIGNYAFSSCSGLTSVTIPSSVSSIGSSAFFYCWNLASVIFNADSCISAGSNSNSVFYGCSSLTNITFGNNVKRIPSSLCSGCSGLISVTIPSGVNSIGSYAFSGCSGLTSVTISNGVTSIDQYAFYGCSGLTSVIFNADSCISAGSTSFPVFSGCSNLTNITFGNNVKRIPSSLCSGCSGLTSVIIPNNVTSIGGAAFYNCSSLGVVYMMPSTPPSLEVSSFTNNASGRVFILYGCAYDDYYNSSDWSSYLSDLRRPTININVTVLSSNSTRGTAAVVMGPDNSTVRCDSTVVVRATANYGYHFDHWSTGSTANPDTVTLTGDITITAYFMPNSYAVVGTSSDNVRGIVTGSDTVTYLDTVILTATPNYGYHIDHWTYTNENNNYTSTQTGGSTLALVATRNRTATAYFNPNQYHLTAISSNTTQGSASGSGNYDYLSVRTITATAYNGYHFDHWSNGSTESNTSITLTSDTTITAYFERNTYNLTVNVNNTSLGMVATPQGTSALYQDTLTVVATASDHHHVASWQGQDIVFISADKNTVKVKMNGNRTLTCNFAIDTHTVAVAANDIARGMVEASGTQFVYGTPCTVTATAYTGYTFHSWSNGVTANPYTFAVLDDVELTAVFIAPGEETYTVTVSVNNPTMGTATANGNASATVMSGETVALTATANEGYRFVRWNDNNPEPTRTITVTSDMNFTAYFAAVQGIEDVSGEKEDVRVYVANGRIHVTHDGQAVDGFRVYDMMGREVFRAGDITSETPALPAGVYLVRVSDYPARKVVVVR